MARVSCSASCWEFARPGLQPQRELKRTSMLVADRLACREVLDCASPLALANRDRSSRSGGGRMHSKTPSRGDVVRTVYLGFVILSSFYIRHSDLSGTRLCVDERPVRQPRPRMASSAVVAGYRAGGSVVV